MFVAIIPGSTFPGILAAYMVNKIFFTIVGGLVYRYLFLEAGAAFDVELGWFRDHPAGEMLAPAGRRRLPHRARRPDLLAVAARSSGRRRRRAGRSSPPPLGLRPVSCCRSWKSYAAKVGVIIVFLAAYSIPVTFDSVMSVIGSSSAVNTTSVTPGRRWHHAGGERRCVERLRGRRYGDRLLALAAARDDRGQPRVRARPRRADLRAWMVAVLAAIPARTPRSRPRR